jgi:hypothetical protein
MGRTFGYSSKGRFGIAMILFQARLYDEGKLEKFWEDKAACKVKGGDFKDKATHEASNRSRLLKRDYGYIGLKDEFARREAMKYAPLANRRKEAMAEAQRNKGRSGLDKAFDALPNKASNELEIGWVGSHPKMRKAQEWRAEHPGEDPKPVKMTAADITSPSNGPCPSKVAYTTLVSWLPDPENFKKQMLSKQRDAAVSKGTDTGAETNGIVSDDLSALKRVHQQFLAQQKATE